MIRIACLARATALAIAFASCIGAATAAPLVTVYSFSSVSGPAGNLTLDGNTLYGVTPESGANDQGTIWSLNVNGTGFQTLHSFSNPPPITFEPREGRSPRGGLLVSGNNLIGAALGGSQEGGIWFSINKNGSNYSIINQFTIATVGSSFGASPNGDLTNAGLFGLAGTNAINGLNSRGVMLGVGIPNTSFPSGTNGLSGPQAGMVPGGDGFLYGTTASGGNSNRGGVYRIKPDGTGYQVLRLFTGGTDGQSPNDILTVVGTKLYGTTNSTIFSMNTDGTGYEKITSSVGDSPLLAVGGKLYGAKGKQVFSLDMTTKALEILHQGVTGDGFSPSSGLVLVGNSLYGASSNGGAHGEGMIYAIPLVVPEPSSIVLAACALAALSAFAYRRRPK
jgi:uncharacterized repeat protein (TIGR03803 family)